MNHQSFDIGLTEDVSNDDLEQDAANADDAENSVPRTAEGAGDSETNFGRTPVLKNTDEDAENSTDRIVLKEAIYISDEPLPTPLRVVRAMG